MTLRQNIKGKPFGSGKPIQNEEKVSNPSMSLSLVSLFSIYKRVTALGLSFPICKTKSVAKMMCTVAANLEILSDMRAVTEKFNE